MTGSFNAFLGRKEWKETLEGRLKEEERELFYVVSERVSQGKENGLRMTGKSQKGVCCMLEIVPLSNKRFETKKQKL